MPVTRGRNIIVGVQQLFHIERAVFRQVNAAADQVFHADVELVRYAVRFLQRSGMAQIHKIAAFQAVPALFHPVAGEKGKKLFFGEILCLYGEIQKAALQLNGNPGFRSGADVNLPESIAPFHFTVPGEQGNPVRQDFSQDILIGGGGKALSLRILCGEEKIYGGEYTLLLHLIPRLVFARRRGKPENVTSLPVLNISLTGYFVCKVKIKNEFRLGREETRIDRPEPVFNQDLLGGFKRGQHPVIEFRKFADSDGTVEIPVFICYGAKRLQCAQLLSGNPAEAPGIQEILMQAAAEQPGHGAVEKDAGQAAVLPPERVKGDLSTGMAGADSYGTGVLFPARLEKKLSSFRQVIYLVQITLFKRNPRSYGEMPGSIIIP